MAGLVPAIHAAQQGRDHRGGSQPLSGLPAPILDGAAAYGAAWMAVTSTAMTRTMGQMSN